MPLDRGGVGPHPSTRLEGAFGGDEQAMMDKVNMPVPGLNHERLDATLASF